MPVLVIRMGMAFLRVKARRRRGVRVFKKQLRGSGFTKEQMNGLVADYEKLGSLRTYLRDARVDVPFLRF